MGHLNLGKFTAKFAYCSLSNRIFNSEDAVWNCVWKWKGPHHVSVFLWMIMHGRLRIKIKKVFCRRHIQSNDIVVEVALDDMQFKKLVVE